MHSQGVLLHLALQTVHLLPGEAGGSTRSPGHRKAKRGRNPQPHQAQAWQQAPASARQWTSTMAPQSQLWF